MVLMWMNLKDKMDSIINDGMRYVMMDNRYNKDGFNSLYKALEDSESYHVEHASSDELIAHLKRYIRHIDFDDLLNLYDAVTDNERFGRNMMTDAEMLQMINGDES